MDLKTLVLAVSASALTASLVTLWAIFWWPAWIALVALWLVALVAILHRWKSDAPAGEPLDFA